jgi:hypothetical protein
MVDRSMARFSSHIDQTAHVGLDQRTEGLEEPSMRVDLFLILFLETKEHLAWHHPLISTSELHIRIHRELGGVLVDNKRA